MRDPLSRVPVKYKLPLSFFLICLVAFGLGGYVVSNAARAAVGEQIRHRLDGQALATRIVVERHLDLLGRRSEDFASDGFIRTGLTDLLGAGSPEERAPTAEALRRHLRTNKLPLVDAFVDAALLAPDGSLVLRVDEGPPAETSPSPASTWFGPLAPPGDVHAYPTFRIVTPLRSLDGARRIGSLLLVVRADRWVAGMDELGEIPDFGLTHAALLDPHGVRLPLRGGGGPAADAGEDRISFRAAIPRNGWALELATDRRAVLRPVELLRDRYLLIGAICLLATCGVLFFPVRFLLRPLTRVRQAARRIAGGDFGVRVDHESRDEIGELSHAFNIMAEAVEERTGRLQAAAEDLRRREGDVRFERDRLDAVIRSMRDGLFILDPDGSVSLANAAARPLLKALETARGNEHRLDCAARDDGPLGCLRCLGDFSRTHRSCVLRFGGRVYEIESALLPSADGTPAGRLCVSRDITERAAAAERQAHQERKSVLGEIAAVMAHELNNPLAAIAMFAQILEEQLAGDERARESASVIRRNTDTCKRVVRGLLDMVARGTPEVARFDLHAMLEDVEVFLGPVSSRAGVRVRLVPGAADADVRGDEIQLRQVFVNLVLNGIQAMEEGGEVTVSTEDREDAVVVRVADDGPGVPESARQQVFEPFFTTKPPGTGTGLGLPTSRRIVEAHGGSLELEPPGGRGAVFRVVVPRDGGRAWAARERVAREARREAADA